MVQPRRRSNGGSNLLHTRLRWNHKEDVLDAALPALLFTCSRLSGRSFPLLSVLCSPATAGADR